MTARRCGPLCIDGFVVVVLICPWVFMAGFVVGVWLVR